MTYLRAVSLTFLIVFSSVAIGTVGAAPTDFAATTSPTQDVIVVFVNEQARSEAPINSAGGTVTGGQSVDLIPVLFATVPERNIDQLERNSRIAYVERDTDVETFSQTTPWGIDRINASSAATSVNESVVDIAIIDTGIDYDHEDLANNVVWGVKTVGGGPLKYGESEADDDNGHGTHVAGTAAAENNDLGVVGVASTADLYAVKVLNGGGSGSLSDVIEGIDAAVKGPDRETGTDDDGDVLSMSLGSDSDSQSLEDTVEAAYEHSVLVAAAGNSGDGDPSTNEVGYPAKYPEVIAVAATNKSDGTPEWSSEGDEVEVAAPGVDVLSTYPDDSYDTLSGTSMATPHVSGTVALMLAELLADGDQDASDSGLNSSVRADLRNATIDIMTDGEDNFSGHGLIQADDAVLTGAAPTATITNPGDGETVSNNVTVRVNATDAEDSTGSLDVEVRIDDGSWFNASYNETTDRYEYEWNTSTVADGDHRIEARATDSDGNSASDQITVTIENTDDPPTVAFVNPTDGDTISGTVTVQINASDDRTADDSLSVEYRIDDGSWRNATYNESTGYYEDAWNTSTVADGEHNLTAQATDGTGNSATERIVVTVDNTGNSDAPAVDSISVIEVNSPSPHAEFEVTWNVSDPNGDLDTVELTLEDTNTTSVEETVTEDVSGSSASGTTTLKAKFDEGSGHVYNVTVTVTDADGNAASETVEVQEG